MKFTSSIKLDLPNLPATKESGTKEDILAAFNAIHTLHQEITKMTRIVCLFESATSAGAAVSIVSTAGAVVASLANATNGTKPCTGFSFSSVAAGGYGEVICLGITESLSALVPGTLYYLSTTSGQITATKPSAAGNLVQAVGYAITSSSLVFNPSSNWTQL